MDTRERSVSLLIAPSGSGCVGFPHIGLTTTTGVMKGYIRVLIRLMCRLSLH